MDYDNLYDALGNPLLQPFVLFYQSAFVLGGSKLDQQIHRRLFIREATIILGPYYVSPNQRAEAYVLFLAVNSPSLVRVVVHSAIILELKECAFVLGLFALALSSSAATSKRKQCQTQATTS